MALDCSNCMACCLYEGPMPILEATRLKVELPKRILDAAAAKVESFPNEVPWPCVWLVISQHNVTGGPCGKCAHYDLRPKVCRDFMKGGRACLKAREYKTKLPRPRFLAT